MNATITNLKTNFLWILTVSAVLLASCGSSAPAVEKVTEVENLLAQIEQAGGSQYASSEFSVAQSKLNEAKQLIDEGKYDKAILKAEEAETDAEMVDVKTANNKADEQLSEIESSIQSLKDKIEELNVER